jgi:hypothetical protein
VIKPGLWKTVNGCLCVPVKHSSDIIEIQYGRLEQKLLRSFDFQLYLSRHKAINEFVFTYPKKPSVYFVEI